MKAGWKEPHESCIGSAAPVRLNECRSCDLRVCQLRAMASEMRRVPSRGPCGRLGVRHIKTRVLHGRHVLRHIIMILILLTLLMV